MGLKNLRLKLKGIRLRRFMIGNGRWKARKAENEKRVPWRMMHVSHGYHVVGLDESWREFDSVVVQREQIQECELWFFGVFDDGIGAEGVTKHMQSHFFDKNMPSEQPQNIGKKSKEAMKRAHLNASAKLRHRDQFRKSGSASAMVINGEKLVMANMGDYRAVVCRDGEAYQIGRKKQQPTTRHWSLELFSGALRVPIVQKILGDSSSTATELVVGSETIDFETEFIILASSGIWEVLRHQEAVNLIRHIGDPHAAAECLANEALVRMSKSNISCLIIRFN